MCINIENIRLNKSDKERVPFPGPTQGRKQSMGEVRT